MSTLLTHSLRSHIAFIANRLRPARLSGSLRQFLRGELAPKDYDRISENLVKYMLALTVPFLRFPMDPEKTRKRLLTRDLSGNVVGIGIFFATEHLLRKTFGKAGKTPYVFWAFVSLMAGALAKTLFQGTVAPKFSAFLDRHYFQKELASKRLNTLSKGEAMIHGHLPLQKKNAFNTFSMPHVSPHPLGRTTISP